MSKTIRVEDNTYFMLDQLRGKGETFDQVIVVLLEARDNIFQVVNILHGAIKYHEWQAKKLQELTYDDGRGASPEVPTV